MPRITERGMRRRDRVLMMLSALVLLLVGGVLGHHVVTAGVPMPDVVEVTVAQKSPTELTVNFGGDTMLADGAQTLLDQAGYEAPFAKIKPWIEAADYTIVNAEAPISDDAPSARPGAKFAYVAKAQAAQALANSGVDALALNNNHAMDAGPQGLTDTRDNAAKAGLTTFGAGANTAEAERPLLLRGSSGSIAVVNLGENFGAATRADVDKPGIVMMTEASVQRHLALARATGADLLVAKVHWGDNYSEVNTQQRYWAQQLIDAGFDLVVGSGSHTAQSVEFVNGKPVFYGLGNFVFGSPGRYADFGKDGAEMLLTVAQASQGPDRLEVRCIMGNNELPDVAYVPRPCNAKERDTMFARALPSNFEIKGDVAVLVLDQ